jgi:putative ABC transport system ATP-binding protein
VIEGVTVENKLSKRVVELVGAGKTYRLGQTSVLALKEVTLSVGRGEFVAIAGPSGSGKTTMLNLVGCLDAPTAGEVFIQEQPVSRLNDKEATRLRRDAIGFIFQSFNLIPVLSVFENVEFPLILKGVAQKERAARVRAIVNAVGLDEHQAHKPDQLSGGQRQRVAIARALVGEPAIVLADEPTANLDSETGSSIIRLMQRINAERNVTFIFSTHDAAIMNLASRRVTLRDGIVETDSKAATHADRAAVGHSS